MEKILEEGTKVLIFNQESQIDGNYTIGIVKGIYFPRNFITNEKLLLPDLVLYEVLDNEGKPHKGHYYRNFLIPEDYKEYLLAQIEDNNEQIKDLTEDNDRITKLISQIDENVIKEQSNQRVLKPKNQTNIESQFKK